MEFQMYGDAYQAVTEYIQCYNQQRIHGSLYDLSPEQFLQAVREDKVKPFVIRE